MDISTLNECMYSSAPSKNCSESQGKNNPHCQNNTLGHIQLQQQTKVAGGRGGHFLDPYLAPPSAAGLLDPPDIRVWARAPFINRGRFRICGGMILQSLFCSDVFNLSGVVVHSVQSTTRQTKRLILTACVWLCASVLNDCVTSSPHPSPHRPSKKQISTSSLLPPSPSLSSPPSPTPSFLPHHSPSLPFPSYPRSYPPHPFAHPPASPPRPSSSPLRLHPSPSQPLAVPKIHWGRGRFALAVKSGRGLSLAGQHGPYQIDLPT